MTGRGKGGKAGKGVAAKRHKRIKQEDEKISNPALRRLARRGGVRRISGKTYEAANAVVKVYLTAIVGVILEYCFHGKRKTVICQDVCYGLKRFGTHMVGYE